MAQARRIKAKPKPKKKKSTGILRRLPWGLLLIVLVCGTVLGFLIAGAQNGDQNFGAGLKELYRVTMSVESEDKNIAELIEAESIEDFDPDFYEVLPDIERVMPDDLPEAIASRPVSYTHLTLPTIYSV